MTEQNEGRVSRWYVWGFVTAVVLFVASAFLSYENKHYMGWETSVFGWINGWPDELRPLFLLITVAPESLWIGLAGVVATFALRMYHITWRLAIGIFGAAGAVYVAKHFVGRARPLEVLHDAHIRVHETGAGFPSGHTAIMTVLALMLAMYLPKAWRWVAAVLIIFMGISRIYLGVHAPLDVVGGFAVGLGAVCFLNILPKKLKSLLRLV